jgi:hypothetical protein
MASFVRRAACNFLNIGSRNFSVSAPRHAKVSVLGAAGGIGQPLSLLLKQVDFLSFATTQTGKLFYGVLHQFLLADKV